MKIVYSITKLYKEQSAVYKKLSDEVYRLITSIKSSRWHYESRIKELESYALKLETGRFPEPNKIEDFFGCMLVVENTLEIKKAVALLKPHIKLEYRRPKDDKMTHKNSDSFVFDDLRLYVTLKPTAAREKGPINDIIFEIQIKTFLQHAWSIATHDLIYKSNEINWAKQRVAYQVKAMLENAEISIEKAYSIKKIPGLPTNEKVELQKRVQKFLLEFWGVETLPKDLIRLVDNVIQLLKTLDISIDILENDLKEEAKEGRGNLVLNLSPYLSILQTIINCQTTKIKSYLVRDKKNKILIPSEIDTSKILDSINGKNVIRI
jgi:ppGpp synthetase/RelA/SpoT-type nucleotidyltranferase